jgi:hypothetical protein
MDLWVGLQPDERPVERASARDLEGVFVGL